MIHSIKHFIGISPSRQSSYCRWMQYLFHFIMKKFMATNYSIRLVWTFESLSYRRTKKLKIIVYSHSWSCFVRDLCYLQIHGHIFVSCAELGIVSAKWQKDNPIFTRLYEILQRGRSTMAYLASLQNQWLSGGCRGIILYVIIFHETFEV